ncbi:MAG: hypothetical protein FWC51_03915 [Proteobacteria bacterium]|nr:hypothetical protein [Pseudomonadota bacterium]
MQNENNIFTPRKKLNHTIPDWVKDNPIFFITINTLPRGQNNLIKNNVIEIIKNSWDFYQSQGAIYITYLLLMPDHLHMLISFNDVSMIKTIRQWKRFISRETGIEWQSDFFDHRIRNDESLSEKMLYIANNPVRKGLVGNYMDWKYQWMYGMKELSELL